MRCKKMLILPAIFGGGLSGQGGGGGGDDSESLSFIPKAYAEGADIVSDPRFIYVAIALIVALVVVTMIANLYARLVIYDQHKSVGTSLSRAVRLFFPFIGLGLWMFLRSFVWLPFLSAIIMAGFTGYTQGGLHQVDTAMIALFIMHFIAVLGLVLYHYPRMYMSVILYITEKTTITAAVAECMKRTQGHWKKIVGNYILFSLRILLITVGLFALGFLLVFGGALGFGFLSESLGAAATVLSVVCLVVVVIVYYFLIQYLTFWQECFNFELSKTIFANPKKK